MLRSAALASLTSCAALACLLLVGCSSSPTRPTETYPVRVSWAAPVQDMDGKPIPGVSRHVLTYSRPGERLRIVTLPADSGTTLLRLPSGTWEFQLVAESDTIGRSDPALGSRRLP